MSDKNVHETKEMNGFHYQLRHRFIE